MKEATDYCALLSHHDDYKYPNLAELHRKLVNRIDTNDHDALANVRACKSANYELRSRGIMV